ncbi:YncE family protein [Taibaiella soli]|uniref:YncE family protein n=1 Tax=Taibaiella soli TaxID=1649169 RepID=A0A2W2B6E7_9BACT|nr:YncE family protein [Taibaiella soli]PZF71779.1 YncE family protein [Taibaiella soli]
MKNKLAVVFCMLMSLNTAFAQDGQYILVLSKGEKKMWVLDYGSLDTVQKVPVGEDPHEIILSPDQHTAYVSNAVIAGTGHIINVIDLKTFTPDHDIDTKPFLVPHGMVYRNDTLWYTAQGAKCIVAYDLKLNKTVQVLGTGQDFTHLLYLTPDGNTFYATNVESGTISVYERKMYPPYMPPTGVLPVNAKERLEWRQTLINVGVGAEGFDVTADGKELWTARPDGYIIIVDLQKKKIKAKINTNIQGLHRIKLTPDGKTACVVSVKTGDLLYYNVATHQLEQKMNIGRGAGIYMDKKANRMFIACTPDNYVSVIDLVTRKEIKKIIVSRPDGIIGVN